jgi:hypothetical protein
MIFGRGLTRFHATPIHNRILLNFPFFFLWPYTKTFWLPSMTQQGLIELCMYIYIPTMFSGQHELGGWVISDKIYILGIHQEKQMN